MVRNIEVSRLSEKQKLTILILTILMITTLISVRPILSDSCSVRIQLKNETGEPIRGAIVTIWMWYTGDESKVIKVMKSDEKGLVEFQVSWKNLLGSWIERAKRGLREKIGLIIDIYDPQKEAVATRTIMINIAEKNPGVIGSTLVIHNMTKVSAHVNGIKNPDRGMNLAAYTPIVEKAYEHRGRANLAHVKTDANTQAKLDYMIAKGDKTRARLVIGYTYSDYTTISDTIYSCEHSESVGKTVNVNFSSNGWISMIMTTRFEIIGYYWQDEDGNLHLMYRELRLWAYDFDVSSLSATKGEDPAWGSYGKKLMKTATGKGFSALDWAITLYALDFYVSSSKIIDLPLSMVVYEYLSQILSQYGFKSILLPTVAISIDQYFWMSSGAVWTIWGADGYHIRVYGRYASAHGVYFMAVDVESSIPSPPGVSPVI